MTSMAIVATGVTADMDGADGASTPLGTPIITVVATGDMGAAGADIELAWLSTNCLGAHASAGAVLFEH